MTQSTFNLTLLVKSPYGGCEIDDPKHNIPGDFIRLIKDIESYRPLTIEQVKPEIDRFLQEM